MNIKKIITTIFHPTTIKIVSLIGIVGFFFILPTYAAYTTQGQTLTDIVEVLQKFLSLCSRGWVMLSILAGKLMTNDFVYGSIIHMDIYLWKIWNIMKNFANFALAGLVVFSIIQGVTGKQALDVKKIITNTLVAGILIQASRFLMGAVVDVSTVATTAIGAFPMAFFKNDTKLQEQITDAMSGVKAQRIFIDLNATGRNNSINIQPNTVGTDQSTRDKLLPNGNSVSGPFIYLGMGVFSFQNYLSLENSTTATTLTLGFVLRFFLIAFFTVGLLLLVIANIMRIGILRIFIIGSPFLILMQVFNKKAGTGGLSKIFNFNNLVATVFKPVIFVAGISLMLIVIVSMQNSITGSGATRENDLNGASLSIVGDSTSVLDIPGISNISINQKDILGKDVLGQNVAGKTKNFFSHLIMLLLTLFLMREFIKISLTIGGGTISDTMEGLLKQAENMAKSTPIVPFKGSAASFNTLQSFSKQQSNAALLKGFGVNKEGRFAGAEEAFQTKVDTWMGVQPSWTGKDYNELTSLANSFESAKYTNFFARSTELAKERKGGLSITNPSWIAAMQTLLSNPGKFDAINKGLGENKFEGPWTTAYKTPEKYFKGKNATALYKIMGGAAAAKGSSTPTDYASLAKITFYPGEQ